MIDKSFLHPIGNKSIVDTVVERITDGIIKGQLKPGRKIPTEIELSESFGVGRNSVREAIKILTALGVLEIRRADGTYVSQKFSDNMINPIVYSLILEKDSSEAIDELRSMFEIGSIELAIEKADEEDIKRLREVHNHLVEEATKDNVDCSKLTDIDMLFHQTIADITHNPLIVKIGSIIARLTRSSQLKTVETLAQMSNIAFVIEVHEEIIKLIENKDYQNIRPVIKKSHSLWIENID